MVLATPSLLSASHFKRYWGSDKCGAVFRSIDDLPACFCMGRYLCLEPNLPVATPAVGCDVALASPMASCERGRGSATSECFGRGSQGTIFVRSSKLSLFFPELCSFRRVFGAKRSSSGAFGFDDVLELFLKTALRHLAFSCELRLRPRVFFENFFSFFNAEPLLLA